MPCGIQLGSGTYKSWLKMVSNNTASSDQTATAECQTYTGTANGATVQARLQEHDGDGLKNKGDLAIAQNPAEANTQFIVGFSSYQFIGQENGVAVDRIPTVSGAAQFDLGAIDALGKPYSGTGSNLLPVATFYNSSTYGRDLYNVVDSARLADFGDLGMKGLLVSTLAGMPAVPGVPAGHTAVICQTAAQQTVNSFGILSISNCGSAAVTGPLL